MARSAAGLKFLDHQGDGESGTTASAWHECCSFLLSAKNLGGAEPMMVKHGLGVVVVCALLVPAPSCFNGSDFLTAERYRPGTTPPPGPGGYGGTDWTFGPDGIESAPAGSRDSDGHDGDGDHTSGGSESAGSTGDDGWSDSGGDPSSGSGSGANVCDPEVCSQEEIPAGQMTAGEWNDLDNWDFWRDVLSSEANDGGSWSELEARWGFDSSGRVAIQVLDGARPVVNAHARLSDSAGTTLWLARTDNSGRAELFAAMFGAASGPYLIEVRSSAASAELEIQAATGSEVLTLQLPGAPEVTTALELAFVIDTTGSMGDEMGYLQAELLDVVQQVRSTVGGVFDLRTSLTFYRDSGDAYEVRSYPFTADVDLTIAALAEQHANGGGDFPEAVDRGLEVALDFQEWNFDSSTRLLFLVLDAPPHSDPEVIERMHGLTQKAAAAGIRIIPVSASGIDKPTEFLLRDLAIGTGGSYVFITDHSGIGGEHLDPFPTIGEYPVELLNELLVRLIVERTGSYPL